MSINICYITCKDEEQAQEIGRLLLEKELIACANIYPVNSLYKWEDKIRNDKEWILWCKTKSYLKKDIETYIGSIHSYEIPCIVQFEAQANIEYSNWVAEQLK